MPPVLHARVYGPCAAPAAAAQAAAHAPAGTPALQWGVRLELPPATQAARSATGQALAVATRPDLLAGIEAVHLVTTEPAPVDRVHDLARLAHEVRGLCVALAVATAGAGQGPPLHPLCVENDPGSGGWAVSQLVLRAGADGRAHPCAVVASGPGALPPAFAEAPDTTLAALLAALDVPDAAVAVSPSFRRVADEAPRAAAYPRRRALAA